MAEPVHKKKLIKVLCFFNSGWKDFCAPWSPRQTNQLVPWPLYGGKKLPDRSKLTTSYNLLARSSIWWWCAVCRRTLTVGMCTISDGREAWFPGCANRCAKRSQALNPERRPEWIINHCGSQTFCCATEVSGKHGRRNGSYFFGGKWTLWGQNWLMALDRIYNFVLNSQEIAGPQFLPPRKIIPILSLKKVQE